MLQEIVALVGTASAPAYAGLAVTSARAPYSVVRPVYLTGDTYPLNGPAITYDNTIGVYCVGASVEASDNLAKQVCQKLDGATLQGAQAKATISYTGALTNGLYESMISVTFLTGAIA